MGRPPLEGLGSVALSVTVTLLRHHPFDPEVPARLTEVVGETVSTVVLASMLPAPEGAGSLFPALSRPRTLNPKTPSLGAVNVIGEPVNPLPNSVQTVPPSVV